MLSEVAEVQYLCTGVYNRNGEAGICWNDPQLGIDWPLAEPALSDKDRDAPPLSWWLQQPEAAALAYASPSGVQ